jgi:phosphatidylserine decarboxylase
MTKKTVSAPALPVGDRPEEELDFSASHYLFPPLHKEGVKFVAIAGLVSILLAALFWPLGFLGLLFTIGDYLFFRDPSRVTPDADGLVISPADGTVCQITSVSPPPELDMGDTPMIRIAVFMSVFNVHVNRSPLAGKVTKLAYTPGKFVNASLDKASQDNERQALLMEDRATKTQIAFVQIAGLIARRIVCFVKEGQDLARGERFGLIRFGSRVDVYLPANSAVLVKPGQTMIAGETVLARLKQ